METRICGILVFCCFHVERGTVISVAIHFSLHKYVDDDESQCTKM